MQPAVWSEPDARVAAAIKAIYRRKALPLVVAVRDMLGELFPDDGFVSGFGVRGRPGFSPGWLALDDPRFDHSVLPEFRSRVVAGGLEQHLLDLLLAALVQRGLVKAGGKQRTDSTHVIGAVRDLNRLELTGESVRAATEQVAAVAPDWFATAIDVPGHGTQPRQTTRQPTDNHQTAQHSSTNPDNHKPTLTTASTPPHYRGKLTRRRDGRGGGVPAAAAHPMPAGLGHHHRHRPDICALTRGEPGAVALAQGGERAPAAAARRRELIDHGVGVLDQRQPATA